MSGGTASRRCWRYHRCNTRSRFVASASGSHAQFNSVCVPQHDFASPFVLHHAQAIAPPEKIVALATDHLAFRLPRLRSRRNWRKNSPTRPQPLRPLLNSKRRSLFSVVSLSKPVAWWIQALVENGTSSRKFSKTIQHARCRRPPAKPCVIAALGCPRQRMSFVSNLFSSHAFVFHRDNTR